MLEQLLVLAAQGQLDLRRGPQGRDLRATGEVERVLVTHPRLELIQ